MTWLIFSKNFVTSSLGLKNNYLIIFPISFKFNQQLTHYIKRKLIGTQKSIQNVDLPADRAFFLANSSKQKQSNADRPHHIKIWHCIDKKCDPNNQN